MNKPEHGRVFKTAEKLNSNTEDIMSKSLVTEREAAQMLNISVSTLRRWRSDGLRPNYIRLGKCIRYNVAELASIIEEKTTKWTL